MNEYSMIAEEKYNSKNSMDDNLRKWNTIYELYIYINYKKLKKIIKKINYLLIKWVFLSKKIKESNITINYKKIEYL